MENEQAMQEAAAAVTASFFGGTAVAEPPEADSVEATTEVVEQPAAETAETVEDAAPVAQFELNPDLPEDIAAELAEAEIDDQVEAEVAAYEAPTDEWGNEVEVDHDAVREAVKLRKRNEYLERQLVESKAGQWKAEAEKFFPLAKHALDDIAKQATSRRRFLKLAEAEHKRILPHVQTYLGEAKRYADAAGAEVKETARAEVKEAWGDPLTNPDAALSTAAAEKQAGVSAARTKVAEGRGTLKDVFAAMMK